MMMDKYCINIQLTIF